VLNVLLGQQRNASYYNELPSQPGIRDMDAAQVFGTVVDLAIQLGGIEQGSDYDAKTDPIVECFETLGQAVLAADGNVNQKELKCLSKYTALAHAKAADLDRRIRSVSEGNSDDPTPPPLADATKKSTGAHDAPATIEQCVAELHALVGLASVKGEVETLTNLARIFSLRKRRGLPVPDVSFHMVFSGNPGTGKTTVARIVAKIYGCLGLLTKGQLIEVDRSGLVGGFVGQTATKTKKVIDQAKGGILFIDEAYALAKESENDFGSEAIEVILKSMEDFRDDLVVIAAGYTDRMAKFLGSNPGLRSRFPKVIIFPDYSVDEMEEIFRRESDHSRYQIDDDAGPSLRGALDGLWQKRGSDFANARDVRNLFERVVSMQADRVSRSSRITTKALTTITEADIRLAVS
jgi:SpoVK/Ycf46/Vps4 family AAA+-type ATPase